MLNRPLLRAIQVFSSNDGDEYYEIGRSDVTAIEWHEQPGHMAMIPTIRVFRNGKLHSEHPFHNVLGIYYSEGGRADG